MNLIIILFAVIYTASSNFLESSHTAQDFTFPILTCTCNKKDNTGKETGSDTEFPQLNKVIPILTALVNETSPQHNWSFSSINLPNYKKLTIEKTIIDTKETVSATYELTIPADSNSHLLTSIWGFDSCLKKGLIIGLKKDTASEISAVFAKKLTEKNEHLLRIIHCIHTASFQYPDNISLSAKDGFELVQEPESVTTT